MVPGRRKQALEHPLPGFSCVQHPYPGSLAIPWRARQPHQAKKGFAGRASPASFRDLPPGRNALSDDKKARAVKDPHKETRAHSDGRGGPCSAGCSWGCFAMEMDPRQCWRNKWTEALLWRYPVATWTYFQTLPERWPLQNVMKLIFSLFAFSLVLVVFSPLKKKLVTR